MANIKFGTDGWRAVVGEDFTRENVEIVTNAIGKYVFDEFGIEKEILVGYDPRNMAKEFATQCADLLSRSGFQVLISKEVIPTPVLAYNAKVLNACAIMFTASHNPPKYLGMKFIPDYAGPATDDITNKIVANLGVKFKGESSGRVLEYDFKPAYFEHIKQIIDFDKIVNSKAAPLRIVFDGLYSATIGYFDKILDEFSIGYEAIHMAHDPNFGGGMPEPKPKYLKELIEKIKSYSFLKNKSEFGNNIPIGLSNDGDGDRFGVINEEGKWVSPNEIIAILLIYLKKERHFEGPLVKTLGGSLLLDKVAQKLGVEVIETAVGFKHVGEAMRKYNPIIGGEDSGGLSIQGHIPEKDGILANLLILEAMGSKEKSLIELEQELYEFAGVRFFTDRIDLKLENDNQVKTALEKANGLQEICGLKVINRKTIDGVKLYLEDNTSWILIRPSGTEPLLRIYFESDSLEKVETLKNAFKDLL